MCTQVLLVYQDINSTHFRSKMSDTVHHTEGLKFLLFLITTLASYSASNNQKNNKKQNILREDVN